MWAIIESGLDLVSTFVDFLIVSSVSVPALQFAGIILVAFLLGLLIGRITKRRVQPAIDNAHERDASRISLDLERLTPLGPLKEEMTDHSAMDISDLRVDQMPQQPTKRDEEAHEEPPLLKE